MPQLKLADSGGGRLFSKLASLHNDYIIEKFKMEERFTVVPDEGI